MDPKKPTLILKPKVNPKKPTLIISRKPRDPGYRVNMGSLATSKTPKRNA